MINGNIRETNELYILFPINGKLESERQGEDIYVETLLLGLLIPTKSNISLRRFEIQSSETVDAHICLFRFDGNLISSGSCRARYITGRR